MNKSYGLIMSSPMILAYLAGRKNQTRRLKGLDFVNQNPDDWEFKGRNPATDYRVTFQHRNNNVVMLIRPPYGWVHDLLYFKETYRMFERDDGRDFIKYRADDQLVDPDWWTKEDWHKISSSWFEKWNSSMFMPQRFSRFRDLKVTSLRAERLLDIDDTDARNEGFIAKTGRVQQSCREAYLEFWDVLNGKKIPAAKNPWVWVYGFPFYQKEQK